MDRPSGSDPRTAPPAPEKFDDLLTRLRTLVDKLEGGNLSLEDSLRCFEEGVSLCRKGAEILDGAEKKVEVLLASPAGEVRTAEFQTPTRDEEG